MEKLTFKEALELYFTARALSEDLPDGMWEELKETVADFVYSYGRKANEWPEDAKEEFAESVAEVFKDWGFSLAGGMLT